MMDELDLKPAVELSDPWAGARAAAAPGAIVMRVMYPAVEFFLEIPRTDKALAAGLDLYDGATRRDHPPA
jgi:hypothetical protein